MSQELHTQHLIDAATCRMPITVEHEVIGPKRILFKITHAGGRSGVISSDRVRLFREEECLATIESFFKGISEVWFPPNS